MRETYINEPEGKFDSEGNLYLPNQDSFGASPGDGTTSGTTGRVLPEGFGEPVDDKI